MAGRSGVQFIMLCVYVLHYPMPIPYLHRHWGQYSSKSQSWWVLVFLQALITDLVQYYLIIISETSNQRLVIANYILYRSQGSNNPCQMSKVTSVTSKLDEPTLSISSSSIQEIHDILSKCLTRAYTTQPGTYSFSFSLGHLLSPFQFYTVKAASSTFPKQKQMYFSHDNS